jgi:acetyl-CoA synthetase
MIHPPQHGDRVTPNYRHPDPHVANFDEYKRIYQDSLENMQEYWGREAERITWFHRWDHVFQGDFGKGEISWYTGGKLNASYNCIDRHLPKKADAVALLWE